MTLDPMPDAATLLRMKAEREGRSRVQTFGRYPDPNQHVETASQASSTTVILRFEGPLLVPVSLRVPWSALVSDNDKYGVHRGKMIAQKVYRDAKRAIHSLALDAMQGRPPAECPVALVARVWMPDNRPHDLTNFCKVVHDGIEGAIVTNDRWLHDVRWIRAGVDVDAPRCELEIRPL